MNEPKSLRLAVEWLERQSDPLPSGTRNALLATLRAASDELDIPLTSSVPYAGTDDSLD